MKVAFDWVNGYACSYFRSIVSIYSSLSLAGCISESATVFALYAVADDDAFESELHGAGSQRRTPCGSIY